MSDNCAVKDSETREKNHHSESNLTETLTDGFLDAFVPSLENLKERLGELTQNQGILIETMQQENAKFAECHSARNLLVMLSYVRTYHSKLTKIQHDMDVIEDRVVRLQKRAMKLKSQKEKEERNKVEAQERQLELERQLTAKLASDHPQ